MQELLKSARCLHANRIVAVVEAFEKFGVQLALSLVIQGRSNDREPEIAVRKRSNDEVEEVAIERSDTRQWRP